VPPEVRRQVLPELFEKVCRAGCGKACKSAVPSGWHQGDYYTAMLDGSADFHSTKVPGTGVRLMECKSPGLQLSVWEPSRRSGWHREASAQVTLNERCKATGCNTSEPISASLYGNVCEPTVSSAREGWKSAGINGHENCRQAPGCWGVHAVKVS
jgi:hypothetical protein